MEYARRVIDSELDELMAGLAAIAIEGPKGVGKTATASRRAVEMLFLDRSADRALIEADESFLDRQTGTFLIDEWQRWPEVWDMVRRSVDNDAQPGRFLLTGSAVPERWPSHTGAGRIVGLRMRPMSLAERGVPGSTVSLAALLTGDLPDIEGDCEIGVSGYIEEIVSSGFPQIRQLPPRAQRAQLDGYLARIVERDFAEQGRPVRRPETLRAWLRAYAAATATSASYNSILDAATPGETDKPAKTTTTAYRDVLAQLWLLDPVPGWSPTANEFGRLGQAPKHHLADPALAARLLGATSESLRSPGPRGHAHLLGQLFESLATQSIRVYAQAAEAEVRHMRTRNGTREIDLILQRADGRVVALEVKLSAAVQDSDVDHLLWLRDRWPEGVLDTAILTTGSHAYRRRDGVSVIPLALLGP